MSMTVRRALGVLGVLVAVVVVFAVTYVTMDRSTPAREQPEQGSGRGTTLLSASFPKQDAVDLARIADAIVVGDVQKVLPAAKGLSVPEAAWARMREQGMSEQEIALIAEQEKGTVYTPVVVLVDVILKGDIRGRELTMRTDGGKVGEETVIIGEGFPTFTAGERVVLFLGKGFDGVFGPIGVYRIEGTTATSRDFGTREVMALPDLVKKVKEHKDEPSPGPAK